MEISRSPFSSAQHVDILDKQQLQGEFCDTLIIPDEGDGFNMQNDCDRLAAHACILTASSPVLYGEILRAKNTAQNPMNGMFAVCLQSVGGKVWKWVLRYLYHGNISIREDEPVEIVSIFFSVLVSLKLITKEDLNDAFDHWNRKNPSKIVIDTICVDVRWDENARFTNETSFITESSKVTESNWPTTNRLCNVTDTYEESVHHDVSCQTVPCNLCCEAIISDTTNNVMLGNGESATTEIQGNLISKSKKSSNLPPAIQNFSDNQESVKSQIISELKQSAVSKTKARTVYCLYCNKPVSYTKDGALKCSRKIKNPACDACKIQKQKKSTLKPKKSGSSELENDDDPLNDIKVGSLYTCHGCGRKLKRYKTFLRHENSCMLKPSDLKMQLQQTKEKEASFVPEVATPQNRTEEEVQSVGESPHINDENIIYQPNMLSCITNIKKENILSEENSIMGQMVDTFPHKNQSQNEDILQEDHFQNEYDTDSALPEKVLKQNQCKSMDDSILSDNTSCVTVIKPLTVTEENVTDYEGETDVCLEDSDANSECIPEPKKRPRVPVTKLKFKRNKMIKQKCKKKDLKFRKVCTTVKITSGSSIRKRRGRKPKVKSEKVINSSLKKRLIYKKLDNYNVCNLCGEIFKDGSKEKLLKHKRTECKIGSKKDYVHGPRRICPICFKQLSSTYKLNFHLKVVHLGEYPYECKMCPERFKYRNAHRDHMMSVHEVDLIECNCCNQKFNTVEKYHRHRTLGLIGKGDKMQSVFMCEVCGETFYDRSNYRTHRLFHQSSDEWKHKCDTCDKSFPQKIDRDRHMMIHTGEKPFLCDICSYSTNRKYNLKLHQRKHEAENSESFGKSNQECRSKLIYSCKSCEAQFKLKTELKAHLKVHDSKKLNSSWKIRRKDAEEENKKSALEEENDSVHDNYIKTESRNTEIQELTSVNDISEKVIISESQAHTANNTQCLITTDTQIQENTVKPHVYHPNIPTPVPLLKTYSEFSIENADKQLLDYRGTTHGRQHIVTSQPSDSSSSMAGGSHTSLYTDRYHNTTGNILSTSDMNSYGNTTELLQPSLPYRGSGFVPLGSSRGMDGWNFGGKDGTISSIEEAFRIIGMPPLVPVSAVDLSAASNNAFTTHQQNPAGTQNAQYTMMNNAPYNTQPTYPGN